MTYKVALSLYERQSQIARSPLRDCSLQHSLRKTRFIRVTLPLFDNNSIRSGLVLCLSAIFIVAIFPSHLSCQEILDPEIRTLHQQLNSLESRIAPIDSELNTLIPEYDKITDEISRLKLELIESNGLFDRISNVFKRQKVSRLSALAQEKSSRITHLRSLREPLVKVYMDIADKLINRCGVVMADLMDKMLKSDAATEVRLANQVSLIWQLAESVSATRNKYSPQIPFSGVEGAFLPPIGNDPVRLRQASKIAINIASQLRTEIQTRRRKLKELQDRKKAYETIIERWREIQRSNEESETRSGESRIANIPTGFSESDIKRKIKKIDEDIARTSKELKELENNVKSLENQSKLLEQRALQIESSRGNP